MKSIILFFCLVMSFNLFANDQIEYSCWIKISVANEDIKTFNKSFIVDIGKGRDMQVLHEEVDFKIGFSYDLAMSSDLTLRVSDTETDELMSAANVNIRSESFRLFYPTYIKGEFVSIKCSINKINGLSKREFDKVNDSRREFKQKFSMKGYQSHMIRKQNNSQDSAAGN